MADDKDKNGSKDKGTDGKTHEFDAEVFSAGTWNGDKYTVADLDDMVTNFDALQGAIKPPVKLGHNEEQPLTDGKPALGWVSKLKRVGDKLIATLSEVPDIVHRALKSGLYKRVSSEIFWNYKNGDSIHKRVLAGVALLGADLPAVTNLEDLAAYLTQSTDKGSFERVAVYEFDTDDSGTITPTEVEPMADENVIDIKKYQAEQQAREKAEAKAKQYQEELAEIRKAEAEKAHTARVEDFKGFLETQVKEFRMTPAGRDIVLKAMDDEKHVYSHETGIAIPAEVFKEFVGTYDKVLDPDETGNGDGKADTTTYATVGEEVNARVKVYMDEKKVTYTQAMKAVLDNDKELGERYLNEVNAVAGGDE